METQDLGKTSTGMQANVEGLLCYVLGWVSGLVFFLIEKENKFVRFHAMQSMVVFGALFVLQIAVGIFFGAFLGGLVPLFNGLIGLLSLILWILLMIKAYQGEKFKLPVAGDIAEKQVEK